MSDQGAGAMAAVCNLERLRRISMDDEEFASELVRTFLEDAAEQVEKLRAAVEVAEADEIVAVAHRLKGGGANVGAEAFAAACQRLETAARERMLERAGEDFAAVDEEWARADGISGGVGRVMRILVVEDDRSAAMTVERILGALGHEAVLAGSATEAWEKLQSGDCRIVISDWMMSGEDGLSLCRRIRGAGLPFYVYIIMLTSRAARGDLLEALSAGADDFLVKPVDPDELRVRLMVGERIVGLETRLRQANNALRLQAAALDYRCKIDDLMQIGNRSAFDVRLRELYGWAKASGNCFAVVMCDVDRFKVYNDSFGHQRGDEILRRIAAAVRRAVRSSDRAFRYGGEEIALLLPELDTKGGSAVAERVRRQVQAIRFKVDGAAAPFRITISCGVASYPNPSRHDEDCLGTVARADEALFLAKRRGRNCVVCWDPTAGETDEEKRACACTEASVANTGGEPDTIESLHAEASGCPVSDRHAV